MNSSAIALALTRPIRKGFPIEVHSRNRFFRLSEAPILSQGESTGCIFIVAETTKQKLAEQALLVSERLAATGRMAHTIAHEINNPLEAITNLVFLLQSSLDKPVVAKEYLNAATTELTRVSALPGKSFPSIANRQCPYDSTSENCWTMFWHSTIGRLWIRA